MKENSQYAMEFAAAPHFGASDFVVSSSNREADAWVLAWPNWPSYGLLVHGPKASGKTHLSHVWQARAQAGRVEAKELSEALLQKIQADDAPLVVEDIEQCADPKLLFHLLNIFKEGRKTLLLTSAKPPAFALPDLQSRLNALPAVALHEPDDTLLHAVLTKQFADRQVRVSEEVVQYVLARMERSFAALSAMVEKLDRAAMRDKKKLTVPYVKTLLEEDACTS